jgi:AcrR family transcriptional regulator
MKTSTRRPNSSGPAQKSGSGKRLENKAKTRKAILKAASELFAKKGFFQTTTDEISAKAKIADGTLFNYFPTKEDLALCFLDELLIGLIEWFQQEERLQSAPLAERLFAIIHQHMERLRPYQDFVGAVYLRALQPASKLHPLSLQSQEYNLRYLRFIREVLSQAEARGELPQVGDLGAYVFALLHLAIITHWLQDDSPGKENTLALLDRSLKMASRFMAKGGWDW